METKTKNIITITQEMKHLGVNVTNHIPDIYPEN